MIAPVDRGAEAPARADDEVVVAELGSVAELDGVLLDVHRRCRLLDEVAPISSIAGASSWRSAGAEAEGLLDHQRPVDEVGIWSDQRELRPGLRRDRGGRAAPRGRRRRRRRSKPCAGWELRSWVKDHAAISRSPRSTPAHTYRLGRPLGPATRGNELPGQTVTEIEAPLRAARGGGARAASIP